MAQQILNVSTPNSGLGDALRDASIKSNDNFTELYEGKVDKVTGKDLSDNNLTDELVTKINDLEANAQVNIQSDWNENDIEADAYIKNKPEQLFASLGYFDYADLATQTTPITVTSGVQTLLTNDTLGDSTNTSQPPFGVNAIWDADSEEFNFQQLSVGDTVDIRVHLKTTTTSANQKYHIDMKFAFDGPSEFENRIFSQYVKTASEDEQTFITTLYIGSEDVKNYPAKIYITSDDDATVKVVGWFCRVFRKSVNIVDLEDPANLISTDPDNAIELGSDGKLWSSGGVGGSTPDATETVKGKIQIATETQRVAGSNDTTAITPLKLKATADEVTEEAANYSDNLVNNLLDGVSTPGNTLLKLYNLILGVSAEDYVADITARNAYDIPHLPFSLFVTDDGDGKWAKYQATTTGVGATFVKISDPDLLNAVMSASAIKAAYESNSDTNAFTNALLSKLNAIAAGATANSSDATLLNRSNHIGTQLASTISDFNAAVTALIPVIITPETGIYYFNDFLGIFTTSTNDGNISSDANVGQTTNALNSDTNKQGFANVNTTTATAGYGNIYIGHTATANFILGGGITSYETLIWLPNLSTSGERFSCLIGFSSGVLNQNNSSNNIAFLYDEGNIAFAGAGGASANWRAVTTDTGTRTFADTGVAVNAGAFIKLRIVVNANASSVEFFIDNTLVATHTTNIPSGNTKRLSVRNYIQKSVGSTQRQLILDYVKLQQTFTTAR